MRDLALGLMSGTSMDGIDVAIIDVHTDALIYGKTVGYPHEIANKIQKVMKGEAFDMHCFAKLHTEIGMAFASAANQALEQIGPSLRQQVKVIGSHGQTVCHQIASDAPYTWQLGNAFEIYQATGIPVVYDFRSKNVAQGGQGAPLAPLYHRHLFGYLENLAVVNIGGISNITLLRKDAPLIGYDVGPGNCMMDAWVSKHLEMSYDKDGAWAASGCVHQDLLHAMLKDDFFSKSYPKSIGKEYYGLQWLDSFIDGKDIHPQDVQATLVHLTASAIARQVKIHLPEHHQVYVCGGGAQNPILMQTLREYLPQYLVNATDDGQVSAEYLEAMMIAWLAWSRIQGKTHDLRQIMGGKDKQLLGVLCD